ncbi:hypothetical protein BJX96DRAFT_180237 [Aspergillus floccosus]
MRSDPVTRTFLLSVQNTILQLCRTNSEGGYDRAAVVQLIKIWKLVVDLELEVLMAAHMFDSMVRCSATVIRWLRAARDRRYRTTRRFWGFLFGAKKDWHGALQAELEMQIRSLVARNETFLVLDEDGGLRFRADQEPTWDARCTGRRKERISRGSA